MQSKRDVIPDGKEIRRRRISKGLKQVQLGDKAGVDVRTVRNIEGGRSCQWYTLSFIATVLGCGLDDLIVPNIAPRIAMMDEVVREAGAEFSRPGGILQRLLNGLDEASNPSEAELELLLLLAVRRDVLGDEQAALRLGLVLIQEAAKKSPKLHARSVIRTATFLDHAGEIKKGLALLNRLLKKYPDDAALGDLYWWALYQKATLLLHSGQVKKAESFFHQVLRKAPREDNQLAAMHQLGVIDLKRGRFKEAEARCLECLRRRLEGSKTDFRAVYEYRRLGEVYANTGRLKEAKDAFEKAEKLVDDWSFQRYGPELKRAQRA